MSAPEQPRPARGRRDHYHHGGLREALIAVADDILIERGPVGFSLREAARRAGVSPGAPAHHFGSTAGLLTELATLGFAELAHELQEAAASATSPAAALRAQAAGYVRFALARPGRFALMSRHDLLLSGDERLSAAAGAAQAAIEATIRGYLGARASDEHAFKGTLLCAWSTAHGFAHLALEGKLAKMAHPLSLDAFVSEVLPDMLLSVWPEK